MVEFSLVHAVTTEMCTGFLTLSAIGILVKFVADGYLEYFFGKFEPLDKVASTSSRYAEPASYFALGAGIFMTFVSMVTGTLSWPIDTLLNSQLAHNKMLLTAMSQTMFIGVFALRYKHRYEIWLNRLTTWIYFLLAMVAFAFIILQNSVAGQMIGKGSLIDGLFPWLKDMEYQMVVFPVWGSVTLIVATALIVAVTLLLAGRSGKEARKPMAA